MDTKRITEELIKAHKTNNPFDIADKLGIIVLYSFMKNTLGFFSTYKRSKFIHLNNSIPEKLQTFVCAHELGHAIMHPDVNTPFLKRHTLLSTDKIERQANSFAVELLMPDSYLSENCDFGIYALANSLGIPKKLVDLKRV